MKKFRIGLIIAAVIIIVAELFIIDYSNLNWPNAIGPLLTVTAMILLIASMLISIKQDKK